MESELSRDLDTLRAAYGQNNGLDADRYYALEKAFADAKTARDATPWVERLDWVREDGQRMIRLVDARKPPAPRWVTANSGPDYKARDAS
jgi:hypothetical protein